MPDIHYDPYDRELMRDPWATYARLRDEAPAYFMPQYDAWVLSRYEDIAQASLDREHYTATQGIATGNLLQKMLVPDSASFMSMDPPDHTVYRKAVSAPFRPSWVNRVLTPLIADRVEEHGSRLLARGGGDVVKEFGLPVASQIAARIAGIPMEDAMELVQQVEQFEPYFHDVPEAVSADAAASSASAEGAMTLMEYFLDQVAQQRRNGADTETVIGLMIEADFDGKRLDDQAIAENALPLFIGGLETFPKHFGSLLYWLDQFPEQQEKVRNDPGLCKKAVEETLRFDAPAPLLGRKIVKPVEWHGQSMEPGQAIMFLYQAANRDERVFERPDEYLTDRDMVPQIAFGTGTHVCAGQHTARLESSMMLAWFLEHFPTYTLETDAVERGVLAGMHGFRRLGVSAGN
jgi:cytochrome P450